MLSNIVLNELDQRLEERGLRFCRWADDFIVLLKSERAAKRVMESITKFLEKELKLPVNKDKSKVALIKDVEFLGFQIYRGKLRISNGSREKFKDKIRQLTRRNNPLSMFEITQKLNEYLQGWAAYFRVQEYKQIFGLLDQSLRNRLRSMQLKKWKKPKKFQRIMIKAGMNAVKARKTWVNMKRWRSIRIPEVRMVLNLTWFRKMGLISLDTFTKRNLEFNLNS